MKESMRKFRKLTRRLPYQVQEIVEWVEKNPGLEKSELKQKIKELPWPGGDPSEWKRDQFEGTRMGDVPPLNDFSTRFEWAAWAGHIYYRKGGWYRARITPY